MKTISPLRRAACVVALSACAAMPALAKDSGFYFGGTIGTSKYDIDPADFQAVPTSAFFKTDDSDINFSAVFGYRLMPFVAVELGLGDFGEIDSTEQGYAPTPPGFTGTLGATVETRLGAKGYSLTAIGTLPLGNFELFGKLGAVKTQVKSEVLITPNFIPTGASFPALIGTAKSDTTETIYGVGAGYTFGEEFFVKLEYSLIPKVGDKDDIGIEPDLEMITFGFQYRF